MHFYVIEEEAWFPNWSFGIAIVTESCRLLIGTSYTVELEYKVTLVIALIMLELVSGYAFSRIDLIEKKTGVSWNWLKRELIAPAENSAEDEVYVVVVVVAVEDEVEEVDPYDDELITF